MTSRKGFSGLPGRHSTETRGDDGTREGRQRIDTLRNAAPGSFSITPAAAACDRRLGRATPLHVIVMLGKYRNAQTGLCIPSIGTLSQRLDISRRSVQRHIAKLIEWGYLAVVTRTRDNGGYTSNGYILLFPAVPEVDVDGSPNGSPNGSGNGLDNDTQCRPPVTLNDDPGDTERRNSKDPSNNLSEGPSAEANTLQPVREEDFIPFDPNTLKPWRG